jgi:ElaB/YqjD/DUF883 family membrane-anchored ribosome-binding protein
MSAEDQTVVDALVLLGGRTADFALRRCTNVAPSPGTFAAGATLLPCKSPYTSKGSFAMSGSSRYSRVVSAEIGEIERHLRSLQKNLQKIGTRAAYNSKESAENFGASIASSLSGWADRFRETANSLGEQSAVLSREAAKAGTVAIDRVARQAETRPFLTIAVAIGVGVLIGIMSSYGAMSRSAD